jgi:hypothetical protein
MSEARNPPSRGVLHAAMASAALNAKNTMRLAAPSAPNLLARGQPSEVDT